MTRRIVTSGLAPSSLLAPSTSLAPSDTIYAGGPIAPHQIWLQVGAGGSLLDVSTYVEFGEGVTYTYGRQTEFDDTSPGTFTFTLNNQDGRFTPDNPFSPYTVTVSEGIAVAWVLGTRIVRGHVLSIEIPSDEASWDQILLTCDDMLGTAGRHSFTSIPDGLLARAAPAVLWKLDDDSDQQFGKEAFGDPLGMFALTRSNPASTTDAVTFGIDPIPGLPGTAVTLTAAPGETNWFGTRHGNTVRNTNLTSPYLATGGSGEAHTVGFWNLWVHPGSTINFAVVPFFGVENPGYAWSAQIQSTPSTVTVKAGTSAGFTYNLSAADQLVAHYLSMQFKLIWQTSGNFWALYTDLFIDGVRVGTSTWYDPQHGYHVPTYLNSLSPVEVSVSATTAPGAATNSSGTVQRISFTTSTATPTGLEFHALTPTLDGRRSAIDVIGEDVNTTVYNGPLSTAPIGFPDDTNETLLDVLNAIVRTESGHMFVATVGTLASSTTYIEVRARDRPAAVESAFDIRSELDGLPSFVRDITNVAASVDVAGPTQTITVTDPTVTGRYITSGTSETVLYTGTEDLREWGQDRLNRGKNRAVRAQAFTVNAVTTPIDRSADLLALVPGDRVRLSNTPATRLGFSSWDGWVIGGSEAHTIEGNRFTFTTTPALPAAAVYDTSLYAAGGELLLGNTYNASAISMVFNAVAGVPVSTVVPYTIQIDSEQLTVTAVTGSTFTVTRGANGTTATSHMVSSHIEVVPTALYAY